MKRFEKVITNLLPFLFVFAASIYRPLDPDLGWHLRYGEYFFKYWQPLRDNIFSTEMADFHWANISWGADLFYYLFYYFGGFFGLSLGAAAVVTLTFYFFSKAFRLDYWEKAIIFPLILFFETPVNLNSFRAQLLSMLLLSILFFLISRFQQSKKALYFVPLLFLFWSNTHGLFLLGLAVFMLWEGFYVLSLVLPQRSLTPGLPYIKQFVIVTFLSLAATVIHPFGIGIYEDALLHVNNPLLKLVSEYGAVSELSVQYFNLVFLAILTSIGLISFVVKKQIYDTLPHIGVFSALYVLSLWVRRYSWAMYYLSIPLIQPLAQFFRPSKKWVFSTATTLFLVYLTVLLVLKYPFSQFTTHSWDELCQETIRCSAEGAQELRKYYKEEVTMTPYNWGGWMIWNYPDMKPSTDGRMHLWIDETGYSAFKHDYDYAHNYKDIDDSKYDVVFAAKQKPIFKRLRKLALEKKWTRVHEDRSSAIFIRNTQKN